MSLRATQHATTTSPVRLGAKEDVARRIWIRNEGPEALRISGVEDAGSSSNYFVIPVGATIGPITADSHFYGWVTGVATVISFIEEY